MIKKYVLKNQIENLEKEIVELKTRNKSLEKINADLTAKHTQKIRETTNLTEQNKRNSYNVSGNHHEIAILKDRIKRYEFLTTSYRAVITNMGKALEREQLKNKDNGGS